MGEEKKRRRKRHGADFKARVALEAIKEQRTVNEIAALYEVHPVQVSQWKKQTREGLADLFSSGRVRDEKDDEDLRDRLYQEIGQLKVELDWLKKSSDFSVTERRAMIDRDPADLSVSRQCDLLGLARSTLYYAPVADDPEDLALMRLLDEQYTRRPFYGVRRMTRWLRGEGHDVNPKRVRRLLRTMGLEAVYPKPRLSQSAPGHRIYPYLLLAKTTASGGETRIASERSGVSGKGVGSPSGKAPRGRKEKPMHEWESLSHVRWDWTYHVVIVPKYRRKVLYGKLKGKVGKILRELCQQKGVELVEGHAKADHVHMCLRIPPK